MESSILEKPKEMESKFDARFKEIDNRMHNLISPIEDETYRCPNFLESSPAKRTFGKKVEGILDDIMQGGGSKRVEICIMGYFNRLCR